VLWHLQVLITFKTAEAYKIQAHIHIGLYVYLYIHMHDRSRGYHHKYDAQMRIHGNKFRAKKAARRAGKQAWDEHLGLLADFIY
jgi:hypothetical protein